MEVENQVIDQSVEVSNQPQETASITQVETPEQTDYKLDKRYGKMWKSENDIYKSYRELEKKYPETQKQLNDYKEKLKKYGVDDISKIDEVGEKYKYYTDPESDLNKFLNYLSPVLNDEKRLNSFKDYVGKQIKDMEIEKFGSHLSDSEREALKKAEQTDKDFQEYKQKQEVAEYTRQIRTNTEEITKYAEEQNLEFDKNAFISECLAKHVPVTLMMDFFKSRAMEHVLKNNSRKTEENVLKNINKSKVGSIPTGNKSTPLAGKASFNSQLNNILGI